MDITVCRTPEQAQRVDDVLNEVLNVGTYVSGCRIRIDQSGAERPYDTRIVLLVRRMANNIQNWDTYFPDALGELTEEARSNRTPAADLPRKAYGKQPFTPEVPPMVLDDDDPLASIGDAETAR